VPTGRPVSCLVVVGVVVVAIGVSDSVVVD
jgi:hypothetical protein